MIDSLRSFGSLRRAWWGLAVFYLTVLADFALYLAQHGGKPSRSLLAFGAGLALLAIGVWVVVALLDESRLELVRARLRPLRWALAPVCLAGLFIYGVAMRPELVYGHAGLALVLTAVLALLTLAPSDAPFARPRVWLALLIAVVVGTLLVRIYALSYYPTPDTIDEPWNLSWSVTYLQTGHVSEITMVGQPGDPTYYTTDYIPRWVIPVAWWMQAVGIGLWQGRLFSLIASLLVIGTTALAARNLYGRRAALFAAGALFASTLLMAGLRLRHDIGLGLALAVSIWLYSEALKRQRAWLHLLAGVVMGWGGFAHYHVLGFAPALFIALYLPRSVSAWRSGRRWPERGAWLYALGLIVGLGCVALVQVLPDAATFLANRAPRNPTTVSVYLRLALLYLQQIGLVSWFELLLIALGVIAALWRRRSVDVSLPLLFVLAQLVLPGLASRAREVYLVPLTPVYALLVGAFLSESLIGRNRKSTALALVAGLCFLMPSFGQTLKTPLRTVLARRPVIAPTPPAAEWVQAHVAPGSAILSENFYYLWLYDYPFISPHVTEPVPKSVLDRYPSRSDFWLSLRPDVIILDPAPDGYGLIDMLIDDPAYLPAHGYQLVATVKGKDGRPTPIYAHKSVVH